jgi:hypothetical protein
VTVSPITTMCWTSICENLMFLSGENSGGFEAKVVVLNHPNGFGAPPGPISVKSRMESLPCSFSFSGFFLVGAGPQTETDIGSKVVLRYTAGDHTSEFTTYTTADRRRAESRNSVGRGNAAGVIEYMDSFCSERHGQSPRQSGRQAL